MVAEPRIIPFPDPGILTWDQLMAQRAEPPPVVRPGVPKVGVTVVAGSPKVGKTLWVSQIALESRRPTLMVIEEGSLDGIRYRLQHQAEAIGIAEPPISVAHRKRMRLDDRRAVANMQAIVRSTGCELVILDPLNRLHTADENRPSDMTKVMDGMAAIAYDCGVAVLAVHHLSKPSAERRGDIWDRFRGASSIRSGTDANLVMDGTGTRVHLVGEFRDAEPLSEWMDLDRDSLTFRPAEGPEAPPTKVDPIALRKFLEERRQVTAAQVVQEFDLGSKVTALRALRSLGCDEFEGARRVLTFALGTVQ